MLLGRFRPSWAQVGKGGIPVLFTLRPYGKYITSDIGEEYVFDRSNKFDVARTRVLYEHRYIGTLDELIVLQRKKEAA